MSEHIYDPVVVEKKWQKWWDDHGTNEIDLRAAKNPYYVLMMFPYPSAEGLHVGNVYAFTGADVTGRHRRLRGHDVFEPIGFDAFGIHSENFAMKINRHPAELIPANIANFTRQLRMMGLMYDWRRSVDTTSPDYYKWTQWIFLQLYKAGLAYRDEKEVNFCPDCGTVIADEQVIDGKCERHPGTDVQRRRLPSWFFRITNFAERLDGNLDWIDWSEKTKLAQKNWIGRSEGAEVDFQVKGRGEKIRVYTTRPDTLFGATFMVLAVDHPLVDAIAGAREKEAIAKYREQAAARATDADATQTGAAPSFGGAGVSPAQAQLHKRGGRYLPHWTKEDATYHVVFRLADSLDQNTLDYIQREKANILKTAEQLNRGLSPDETKRLNLLSSDKIEEALNRGYGECILGREKIASIVADALKHFDNDRYDLIAWCVMPNHVHVIVHPLGKNKLADIVHSWKSFSSKKIIAELGDGRSQVWQEEYFDHIVRNEESLGRQITYVIGNPEAAGLKNWKWRGQLSEDDMRGRDARATNAAHDTDVRSPQASVPQSTESIVREKTGVFIGANAINPVNNAEIPIYISDYVLSGYGTGAIMAVPAHDERDFEFAEKFHLPIKCVISPDAAALAEFRLPDPISRDSHDSEAIREEILKGQTCWSGAGVAMNSANAEVSLNGLAVDEAKARITKWLESKNLGKARTTFRLRDWGISRQRYWGPPIPVLYDEDGNIHPVPEDQLPVTLPPIRDFRPKGDGRGPLANVPEWMNVEINGKKYRRETDVMDNFLDSAWYYLRYVSTDEDSRPYDPELIRKWLPLDVYIGGNEHAVLHLLYTRFICMALDHAGALKMGTRPGMRDAAEPFQKFRAHGLLIKEGSKMSKSKGNVVNPDEYVEKWGADTLRLYLMFLGPYQQGGDFRDTDIVGMRRFLNRLHTWYYDSAQPIVADETLPKPLRVKTHQTIKKVREDIDALSYNTAISAIMELFNMAKDAAQTSAFVREAIIIALAPLAPHFAEEIWQGALRKPESIWKSGRYPDYIEELTKLDEMEIVLQVNGKIRDKIIVPRDAGKEQLEAIALSSEKVQAALAGATPKKIIVVPGRLINVLAS